MSLKSFYDKYEKQLRAVNPKYDVVYDLSKDDPITYENSENLRLSFSCIADTHLPDRDSAEKNLENAFFDIFNSKEKTDALLMAGDIADYGLKKEYKRFFGVFDKYKDKIALILTGGNHDYRFFFNTNSKIIRKKTEEYLGISLGNKTYYSYDLKGYTFIVLSTEERVLEKAQISKEQIAFLESELKRGTKSRKPVFIMCHQPFAFTHGLPEVWKTGDMGEQSDDVRKVTEKYKNVFFINGHLHGGVYEKVPEVINSENNVHSISIPGYRKENNFGITDAGVGYTCEVYDEKIIFKARNFLKGEYIKGDYSVLQYEILKG